MDDEPKNLTVLETVLDDPGYRLVRAESADQALLALVVEEFALLILDIRMPGMTGFELAQMIKERKKTARVPIIFLTAYYNEDQHVLEGYHSGAVDYLHKPVNPAILRSKVAVFAELHRKQLECGSANRALLIEVTERRRAEEQVRELNETLEQRVQERTNALRESEARLRLAQDAARLGTFDWNIQTGMNVWTPELEAMYGLPTGGFAGTQQAWEKLIHPEDRAEALRLVERAFDIGQPVEGEWRVIWPNSSVHWLGGRFQVLKDAAGVALRMTGVNLDITERKKAEEELREADRRKDEFLAILAHELRNPLAPIRLGVEILRTVDPSSFQFRDVRDMIERQVVQMSRLVDDLLDVSRITRGKVLLQMETVELVAVVDRAIETSRPLVDARRHELTVSVPIEPVRLKADVTRLAQVFANVLNNAAKYTEEGGHILLTASSDGTEAVIRVRDTGIGIDPDMLPRIFDLFSQGNHSLAHSEGGLGIGLTLVRSLVELHGGSVQAFSEGLGKGSEFVVRLPVLVEPPVSGWQRQAPTEAKNRAATPPRRILLVDDNKDAANSLAILLRLDQHEVLVVNDGPSALEQAPTFHPDVIFLDIGMPDMNGYEVARIMRDSPSLRQVLLVAMTGYGQEEDKQRSHQAGFDAHLVKPVDPNVLLSLLAGSEVVGAS